MARTWLKNLFKPKVSDLISTLLQGRRTIITGLSGTGKTMLLSYVLEKMRDYPAVIFDPLGEHVGMLYRPGDHILNPRDSRSEYWTPWMDIRKPEHLEEIVRSLVPRKHGHDPIWVEAERKLLMEGLTRTTTRSVEDLHRQLRLLAQTRLPELDGWNVAAYRISPDLTPTRVAFVFLASSARYLNYLWRPGSEPEFSLRDWVRAPSGWLFITSDPGLYQDLSPLLSTWLEVLASELLCLETAARQMFIVIDGLTDLQPLPAFQQLLTEDNASSQLTSFMTLRKTEDLQLDWGEEAANSLFAQCGTVISFYADCQATLRRADIVTKLNIKRRKWPNAAPRGVAVDEAKTCWGAWVARPEVLH